MATELVHLRLENKMRSDMKDLMKYGSFSTETEFIRDAIRRNIELHRKFEILERMRNTVPRGDSRKVKRSDLFRAFGLE